LRRGEEREIAGTSGTWSRDGTPETCAAFKAIDEIIEEGGGKSLEVLKGRNAW